MHDKNHPKISVIIPVYNSDLFLHKCVNSIIEQTFTDFEVILVDDNSSDNCPAICEEYANLDNRIKVIYNKSNMGSSISRKIGLDHAAGTYIQFIDSDDWIEKDMFEKLYTIIIFGDFDMVWCEHVRLESPEKMDIYKKLFDNESAISAALWNKLVKRDIASHINFPESMMWEDLVITVQLVNKAKKIKFIQEVFYHHIENPSSICNKRERRITGLKEIITNLTSAIDYCRDCLGPDFIKLEPELSACVNRFKFESIFFKDIRDSDLFLIFYPESNKNVLSRTWKAQFYKKLFLYAYLKKIPGFCLFLDVVKCLKY